MKPLQWMVLGLLLLVTPLAGAQTTRIAHGSCNAPALNAGGCPGAINTTGANLLVVWCQNGSTYSMTVEDTYSNVWTPLQSYSSSASGLGVLFYTLNPTVGTNHNFACGGSGGEQNVAVVAYSLTGGATLDTALGTTSISTTVQPGSITPGECHELFVTGWGSAQANGGSSTSINSSFTLIESGNTPTSGDVYADIGLADLLNASTAAENPTWSNSRDSGQDVAMAAFKPGTPGCSGGNNYNAALSGSAQFSDSVTGVKTSNGSTAYTANFSESISSSDAAAAVKNSAAGHLAATFTM